MIDKKTTCCFTGHRAGKLPWGFDEENEQCVQLKTRIADAVEAVYASGIRHFICGMANGADIYFCEAVIALRDYRELTLEAAIPYEGQSNGWPEREKRRYDRLVSSCDFQTLVCREYTHDCMMRRNRYMVDASSVLIAAYGGERGGTMNTLLYAMRQGLEVIQIGV